MGNSPYILRISSFSQKILNSSLRFNARTRFIDPHKQGFDESSHNIKHIQM